MDPLPSMNKVYSLVVQEESNNDSISLPSVTEDQSILVKASDAISLDIEKFWLVLKIILGFVPFASVPITLWNSAIKNMDTPIHTNPTLHQILLLLEMQIIIM